MVNRFHRHPDCGGAFFLGIKKSENRNGYSGINAAQRSGTGRRASDNKAFAHSGQTIH